MSDKLTWPYKVFYYTVLSFVIIAVSTNVFKLGKTIVYQIAEYNLDGGIVSDALGFNEFGTMDYEDDEETNAQEEAREEGYVKSYFDSLLSIIVAILVYIFLYYYVNTDKFSKA